LPRISRTDSRKNQIQKSVRMYLAPFFWVFWGYCTPHLIDIYFKKFDTHLNYFQISKLNKFIQGKGEVQERNAVS